MLQAKLKHLLTIPESTPLSEPILLPHRGRPWRIAELEALADDEVSYELIRGELFMMTPASPQHGIYALRLGAALLAFVEEHQLGIVVTAEPGFILQPEPEATVRAPDIAFIRTERIPPVDQQEGFWPLAPDLVVEIISPSESADSIQGKLNDYLGAGTSLIWLVYPRLKAVVEYHTPQQVRQYGTGTELEGGDVLPGFRFPLKSLFREA
jgi:Uma2 family endonuclease